MTEIRPSEPADLAAFVQLWNAVNPLTQTTAEEMLHEEASWDADRYFRHRLLAFSDDATLVGYGVLTHLLEQFHPDKYLLNVGVHPDARRQGHGNALYTQLLTLAQIRQAIMVRGWTREDDGPSNDFVQRRGFIEAKREWQSQLFVAQFNDADFAGAAERPASHGITITTLAEETRPQAEVWREIYELDCAACVDIPEIDPFTPMPYDLFITHYFDAPHVIPEAYFLAKDGERYVGLCRVFRNDAEPHILEQELTAVDRAYRGMGIAMALKLKTVDYARAAGKSEIRTWNASTNKAMLRINEAMGFTKTPAEIVYLKDLTALAASDATGANAQDD